MKKRNKTGGVQKIVSRLGKLGIIVMRKYKLQKFLHNYSHNKDKPN